MSKFKIYTYFKDADEELVNNIKTVFELDFKKETYNNIYSSEFDEDFIDEIKEIRDSLTSDLFIDVVSFLSRDINTPFIKMILEFLPELDPGNYLLSDIIIQAFKQRKTNLVLEIKNYILDNFNQEIIDTYLRFIDDNLNASKASSDMYIHRNTINYRLDSLYNKLGLNIRNINDALAFYLLFK